MLNPPPRADRKPNGMVSIKPRAIQSLLSLSKRGVCEDAFVISDRPDYLDKFIRCTGQPIYWPCPEVLGVTCDL